MKSLCASLICENKNSYFSEGRAAHLFLGEHHIAGLQWAVSLGWFAALFSGVKEKEGWSALALRYEGQHCSGREQ